MKIPYVDLPKSFRVSKAEYILALEKIFDTGQFILGDLVASFEADVAAYCGVRHAVAVNSGYDALQLALKALRVEVGDEVITAPNSFVASASAIANAGGRIAFADVGEDRNLDIDSVLSMLTPRTRVVMPVHLAGLPFDVSELKTRLGDTPISIVEDCAQAIGSSLRGAPVGTLGDVGCFSFHPLKNLGAIGDGGCVVTNDQSIADLLRRLRNHGLKDRNTAVEWGYNSRLDPVQAAWLKIRLRALPGLLSRRRTIAEMYRRRLVSLPNIKLPSCPLDAVHTWHAFVIRVRGRDSLQTFLAQNGVEALVHYPIPLHRQPAAVLMRTQWTHVSRCDVQAGEILSLPIRESLLDEEVDHVIDLINTWAGD